MGADASVKPFTYIESGKLVGFDTDIAREMVSRLKWKAEWRIASFGSLLLGLRNDRYDLVALSHTVTPEREREVIFLRPLYCTYAVMVSRMGGPKTIADLAGKTVVTAMGTDYLQWAHKITYLKSVESPPTEGEALQSFLSGRSDAWLTDEFGADEALRAHPKDKLQVGDHLFRETNSMVVAKGNEKLRDELNKILDRMLADGSYKQISLNHFGRDIRCTANDSSSVVTTPQ